MSIYLHRFTESFPDRRWITISCILLAAFSVRILALYSLKDSIYFDYLLIDERYYHNWALQLVQGTWQSSEIYELAPLPAYFVAFIYKIISPNPIFFRSANIIFGVLTCFYIGLCGKEIGGRKCHTLSLLIASFYTPLIFYSIVPLKTAMSLFLFSLFMWLFLNMTRQKMICPQKAIFLGIISGLMINVRANYIIILPVAFIFLVFSVYQKQLFSLRLFRNILFLVIGFIIAIAPFMLRNYYVTGSVAVTTSQAGFNLFIGNNPENKTPYYRPVPFASSSPFFQGRQFNIEANRRAGSMLTPEESSLFWIRSVIHYYTQHPDFFLQKLLQKTLAFFNADDLGDHYHIGFLSNHIPFFQIPMLKFWMIFPLAMAGMIIGALRKNHNAGAVAIFVAYGLTLIAFFCNTRYRLPLLVIMIPFAVSAGEELYIYYRKRENRNLILLLSLTLLFAIIQFVPVNGCKDLTAYYNTHALVLNSHGQKKQAIRYWQLSSDMAGAYSAYANLALAGYFAHAGSFENAAAYLDKISPQSFAASSKYEVMADILRVKGDLVQAEQLYTKALEINSGRIGVRRKLIILLRKNGKEAASLQHEEYRKIMSYYN